MSFGYINPEFWAVIRTREETLHSEVMLINAVCAAFDDTINELKKITGKDHFSELRRNKTLQEIKLLNEHNEQQQLNFQHKAFGRHITIIYGGEQNIGNLELYTQHYPYLALGKFGQDDLTRLKKHLANPGSTLEAPVDTEGKTIWLVEDWRNIPEVAKKRRAAEILFKAYFLRENYSPANEMKAEFKKDLTKYFKNQPVLAPYISQISKIVDDYWRGTSISNNLEVKKAIDFLMDELIDIMAQLPRIALPENIKTLLTTDELAIVELSENELEQEAKKPYPIICHNRDLNATSRVLLKRGRDLGLIVPEQPSDSRVAYFKDTPQIRQFYEYNSNYEIKADDFEPGQLSLLKMGKDFALEPPKNKKTPSKNIPITKTHSNEAQMSPNPTSPNSANSSLSSSPTGSFHSTGSTSPASLSTSPSASSSANLSPATRTPNSSEIDATEIAKETDIEELKRQLEKLSKEKEALERKLNVDKASSPNSSPQPALFSLETKENSLNPSSHSEENSTSPLYSRNEFEQLHSQDVNLEEEDSSQTLIPVEPGENLLITILRTNNEQVLSGFCKLTEKFESSGNMKTFCHLLSSPAGKGFGTHFGVFASSTSTQKVVTPPKQAATVTPSLKPGTSSTC